jgi:hypothetical protein
MQHEYTQEKIQMENKYGIANMKQASGKVKRAN